MKSQKKEGSFDPGRICDLSDELNNHSYVLKAFAALLRESSLFEFSVDPGDFDREKEDLRWGLQQIVDMYIEKQESIIEKYTTEYWNSDIRLVESAKGFLSMIKEGAFMPGTDITERLKEHMNNLDTVISRDGELRDDAEALKRTFTKLSKESSTQVLV